MAHRSMAANVDQASNRSRVKFYADPRMFISSAGDLDMGLGELQSFLWEDSTGHLGI